MNVFNKGLTVLIVLMFTIAVSELFVFGVWGESFNKADKIMNDIQFASDKKMLDVTHYVEDDDVYVLRYFDNYVKIECSIPKISYYKRDCDTCAYYTVLGNATKDNLERKIFDKYCDWKDSDTVKYGKVTKEKAKTAIIEKANKLDAEEKLKKK